VHLVVRFYFGEPVVFSCDANSSLLDGHLGIGKIGSNCSWTAASSDESRVKVFPSTLAVTGLQLTTFGLSAVRQWTARRIDRKCYFLPIWHLDKDWRLEFIRRTSIKFEAAKNNRI
jgi:hypothetical protein